MKTILTFCLLIPFLLFSQEEIDTTIVLYPDIEAEFPGGPTEMKRFIIDNLEYPKIEFETVPNGRIFVEFIINIDGSIEQVIVRKEGLKELDNAYIELVKNMPNWIPAEVEGKKVRSRALLPFSIHFQ
ncbi:energy transducer TonB [Brumimicrobium sp.]|uniref:energy transducer TonB n=1 Tax=Brumimicrobium sp. TaxID=2029867 RepID=UPI003A8F209D